MAVPRSEDTELDELVEDAPLDDDDELGEPDEDVFDEEDFAEAPEDEAVFGPDVPDVADVEDVDDTAGTDINLTVVEAVPEEDSEEEDVLVRVVGEEDEELDDVDGLREGEFICASCFLVKGPTQLADATRMICVDCV
ncbi:MAG: hypothetical protein ABR592_03490 [Nitriliruptorales bacterium]